jgi:hypothetical protein
MEYLMLSFSLILAGAGFVWWSNKRAYEKGITTAVLLHREGRLKYKDYDDEDGVGMVDIQIAPTDED